MKIILLCSTIFFTIICSCISQETKLFQIQFSGQFSHNITLGQGALIEIDPSSWTSVEVVALKKMNMDEVQLGLSYNHYARTIYDYQLSFGCDLGPNGQPDNKASGIRYGNKRIFIGIPIHYVIGLGKNKNRFGLKFGVEPRFKIDETGTHAIFECNSFDPSRPVVELEGESIGSLYFAKVGLVYIVNTKNKVKFSIEPIIEFLLNEDKFNGILRPSLDQRIANRMLNAGIKIGIRL